MKQLSTMVFEALYSCPFNIDDNVLHTTDGLNYKLFCVNKININKETQTVDLISPSGEVLNDVNIDHLEFAVDTEQNQVVNILDNPLQPMTFEEFNMKYKSDLI